MGSSHLARSSSDRSVRRWIRRARSRSLAALSASGEIAGRNEVKCSPVLPLTASRGREGVPEEGEGGLLVLSPTTAVTAVDDPRLVGVEPEAHLPHPLCDLVPHVLRLPPALAVHDGVVGVPLEGA